MKITVDKIIKHYTIDEVVLEIQIRQKYNPEFIRGKRRKEKILNEIAVFNRALILMLLNDPKQQKYIEFPDW